MMKFSLRQRVEAWCRKLWLTSRSNVTFGANVYVGRNATITGIYRLTIGSDVYIGKNVTIEVEGVIGSGVLIGNNVGVVGRRDHDMTREIRAFDATTVREDRALSLPVRIEDGAWIGFGAIVLSGTTIGRNAIVGAGAVVKDDVPPYSVVAGNPAVVVKHLG